MNVSQENYIKAIFKLRERTQEEFISTNSIAQALDMAPASVTEMIKKLKAKNLVVYIIKFRGKP